MVSYPRRLHSGHFTCYLNRTYHVLTTGTGRYLGTKRVLGYPKAILRFNNFGTLPRRNPPRNLVKTGGPHVMPRCVLFVALALISLMSLAIAQSVPTPSNSERKVALRVTPDYPELARRMHIHGVVKVEAIVRPNGTVKTTRVLGGNPVLVDPAAAAVGKWKFEPAQTETTEVVQVVFESQ